MLWVLSISIPPNRRPAVHCMQLICGLIPACLCNYVKLVAFWFAREQPHRSPQQLPWQLLPAAPHMPWHYHCCLCHCWPFCHWFQRHHAQIHCLRPSCAAVPLDNCPGASPRKDRWCKAVACAVDLHDLGRPYCLKKGRSFASFIIGSSNCSAAPIA